MSNRQRVRRSKTRQEPSESAREWWESTGLLLKCRTCRSAPLCDFCGVAAAVHVMAVAHDSSDLWRAASPVDLRGSHHDHLCRACYARLQRVTGAPSREVG